MPTRTGKSEVALYFRQVEKRLSGMLRGAGRAGGEVIAAEAKSRAASAEVADNIEVRSEVKGEEVRVRITVKHIDGRGSPGWAYSKAVWLEYGTAPHFISVDDRQRGGLGIGKINAKFKEADGDDSLVIDGKFVGSTVFHPGARPHPFLRPALDTKEREALAAAQNFINSKVSRAGIAVIDEDPDV